MFLAPPRGLGSATSKGGIMITGRRSFHTATLAGAILIIPAVAAGQTGTGPVRIGGLISGSTGAGDAALTLGASASYRLVSRLSVEGDVSHFSDLTLAEFPGVAPNSLVSFHARTTAATVNAVFDLPAGVRWLRPYRRGWRRRGIRAARRAWAFGRVLRATPRHAACVQRWRRRRLSSRGAGSRSALTYAISESTKTSEPFGRTSGTSYGSARSSASASVTAPDLFSAPMIVLFTRGAGPHPLGPRGQAARGV